MKTCFDKIYVLSLITNKQRQEFIKYQMDELGINFEFLYGTTFYKLTYDAHNNKIIYPNVWCWDISTSGRDYGCTISHYNAVLFAYELQYNNVLIIEDDICFIKNKELIEYYLNNIPNDTDFVTFDTRFASDDEFNKFINECKLIKDDNKFMLLDNSYINLCGGMMYGIMNREAMKLYLNNQNTQLMISDQVKDFFKIGYNSINRYTSTKCICLEQCALEHQFNKEYEDINLIYKTPYKNIYNLSSNEFYIPNTFLSFSRF